MLRRSGLVVLSSLLLWNCVADDDRDRMPALDRSQGAAEGAADAGTATATHSDEFPGEGGAATADGGAREDADAPADTSVREDDAAAADDAGASTDGAVDEGDAGATDDAGTSDDAGDPPDVAQPSAACSVDAFLEAHCVGCHGPTPRSGVELDSLALLREDSAKYPGQSIGARAVARMRDPDRPMPPKGDRMAEADIALVEAWVADGMPVDSCP